MIEVEPVDVFLFRRKTKTSLKILAECGNSPSSRQALKEAFREEFPNWDVVVMPCNEHEHAEELDN